MKKSVMLVIIAIYLLSIILVGFIGIRMKVYDEIKYVDAINVIDTSTYKYHPYSAEDAKKMGVDGYYSIKYVDGLRVPLKFEASPVDATDRTLKYLYEETADWHVIKNTDGTAYVEFYDAASAIITVQANDSKGYKIRIRIDVYNF